MDFLLFTAAANFQYFPLSFKNQRLRSLKMIFGKLQYINLFTIHDFSRDCFEILQFLLDILGFILFPPLLGFRNYSCQLAIFCLLKYCQSAG
jgi:hypothetical protein